MKLQVLNVHFFPKKGEILINRGVYSTWLAQTTEGEILVKLKGFDRYYFNPDTFDILSKVADGRFRIIQKFSGQGKPYYYLYFHGHKTKFYLADILRENMKGIETFFDENTKEIKKKRNRLEIAQ
jgi:hypothetical protein